MVERLDARLQSANFTPATGRCSTASSGAAAAPTVRCTQTQGRPAWRVTFQKLNGNNTENKTYTFHFSANFENDAA